MAAPAEQALDPFAKSDDVGVGQQCFEALGEATGGIVQRVEQIHRAIWRRPDDLAAKATQVREFTGGQYRSRFALAARATSLGYRVSGGHATARVRDGGRTVEACVWIGEPYWDDEVETGGLTWQDQAGRALPLGEVGPVAWSEGMRMAAALYAGRVIEEGKDA